MNAFIFVLHWKLALHHGETQFSYEPVCKANLVWLFWNTEKDRSSLVERICYFLFFLPYARCPQTCTGFFRLDQTQSLFAVHDYFCFILHCLRYSRNHFYC